MNKELIIHELYSYRTMYLSNWLKLVGNDSIFRNEFNDIFNDIIIKIWESNKNFNEFKYASYYVNKALKNKSINYFRHSKNIIQIQLDTIEITDESKNLDYLNVIWEDRGFKKTVVYKVAYLWYNIGLKYNQIANFLNIKLSTVKSRLWQFRNNILPKLTVKYELN